MPTLKVIQPRQRSSSNHGNSHSIHRLKTCCKHIFSPCPGYALPTSPHTRHDPELIAPGSPASHEHNRRIYLEPLDLPAVNTCYNPKMLRASIASIRPRGTSAEDTQTSGWPALTWLHSQLVPYLQAISRRACTHPIRTIVLIAILASTTYIALLESCLFEPPPTADFSPGQVDIANFMSGSKTLYASKDTDWRWQNGDYETSAASRTVCQA